MRVRVHALAGGVTWERLDVMMGAGLSIEVPDVVAQAPSGPSKILFMQLAGSAAIADQFLNLSSYPATPSSGLPPPIQASSMTRNCQYLSCAFHGRIVDRPV
jgi:hypothetical protein